MKKEWLRAIKAPVAAIPDDVVKAVGLRYLIERLPANLAALIADAVDAEFVTRYNQNLADFISE